MKRGRNVFLGAVVWMICGSAAAEGLAPAWGEISLESQLPTRDDRQIDTRSLHLLFGKAPKTDSRIQFAMGLTLTRAEGELREASGDSTSGIPAGHDSDASGLGPAMQVRFAAWRSDVAGVWLQANGALILYDRAFPYGGEHYNFMWRVGPALRFKLGSAGSLSLQYHWMHVSNGLGSGDHNPAYDARGASLGWLVDW